MKAFQRKKLAFLSLALALLSACRHENPLETQSRRETLNFLFNASANAEKRLNFPIHKDAFGYAYLECMEGDKSPEINCKALYQTMIEFAQEGHYPAFKAISLADLKAQKVFDSLADDYAELAAASWPNFISGASHEPTIQ